MKRVSTGLLQGSLSGFFPAQYESNVGSLMRAYEHFGGGNSKSEVLKCYFSRACYFLFVEREEGIAVFYVTQSGIHFLGQSTLSGGSLLRSGD